jgi:hypothetical protein
MLFRLGPLEWGWTDWLGLIGLLLAAAFVATVVVALVRGTSPLALLDRTGAALVAIVGRRSTAAPKRKRGKNSN